MSDAIKTEMYRLLGHLEAAEVQLESLERLGPMEDLQGKPLPLETQEEKERLRRVIDSLTPRLAILRKMANA